MKKIMKRSQIDFYISWAHGIEISKIRKDLDALEALGATHVNIEVNSYYDSHSISIEAFEERLETDEEFTLRMAQIAERDNLIKERELAELERLQAKYNLLTKTK